MTVEGAGDILGEFHDFRANTNSESFRHTGKRAPPGCCGVANVESEYAQSKSDLESL